MLLPVAFAVLLGMRVLVVVLLRLARPIITLPLLAAMIGGAGMALAFAAYSMWHDAARAALLAFVAAMIVGLYAVLVQAIDPEHFHRQAPIWRRF